MVDAVVVVVVVVVEVLLLLLLPWWLFSVQHLWTDAGFDWMNVVVHVVCAERLTMVMILGGQSFLSFDRIWICPHGLLL